MPRRRIPTTTLSQKSSSEAPQRVQGKRGSRGQTMLGGRSALKTNRTKMNRSSDRRASLLD